MEPLSVCHQIVNVIQLVTNFHIREGFVALVILIANPEGGDLIPAITRRNFLYNILLQYLQ